jgi:hypothetical protein
MISREKEVKTESENENQNENENELFQHRPFYEKIKECGWSRNRWKG